MTYDPTPDPLACSSVCTEIVAGARRVIFHVNASARIAVTPDAARRLAETLIDYAEQADELEAAGTLIGTATARRVRAEERAQLIAAHKAQAAIARAARLADKQGVIG